MIKRAGGDGLGLGRLRWLLALALESRAACRSISQGGSEAGLGGGEPNVARGAEEKGL